MSDVSSFNSFVLIGSGHHAISVGDLLESIGVNKIFVCKESSNSENLTSYPEVEMGDELLKDSNNAMALAIGNQQKRREFLSRSSAMVTNLQFPALIHRHAYVSRRARLSEGATVFAFAYIGPDSSIGSFGMINTGAIVEHEVRIGCNSIISPGVTVAGNVSIGENVFVGINSSIGPNVEVQSEVIIGANSFVRDDVPSKSRVFGSPAKQQR